MADDVADLLADLQRRIRALETAPRASETSVRGGYTRWLARDTPERKLYIGGGTAGDDIGLFLDDGTSTPAWYLGTAAGSPVFYVTNADGTDRIMVVSAGGLLKPYALGGWTKNPTQTQDSLGATTTTSSSFEIGWRTLANAQTASLITEFYCALGGGVTQAEVRVTATVDVDDRSTSASNGEQTVFTQTITGPGNMTVTASVPSTIWTPAESPTGAFVRLALKARVSGGAGTVTFAPVVPARFG